MHQQKDNAQRSLDTNIHSLAHRGCLGGIMPTPPWRYHAWEHTDHPPETVFGLSKTDGNHCSYTEPSRASPFLVH